MRRNHTWSSEDDAELRRIMDRATELIDAGVLKSSTLNDYWNHVSTMMAAIAGIGVSGSACRNRYNKLEKLEKEEVEAEEVEEAGDTALVDWGAAIDARVNGLVEQQLQFCTQAIKILDDLAESLVLDVD